MLANTQLDYVQHLERGYCENHPDVIAQTKEQVVDRAVKQLLTALQANGFELDGNILKRGNGWLQYDAVTSQWQYSNDAGVTWLPMTQGVSVIGEIRFLSHNTIPAGWHLCDGSPIARSSALGMLYDALGFPFGTGDGSTTCNLPDLRDVFPIGAGLSYALGQTGGEEAVTLDAKTLPEHPHDLAVPYASAAGTAETVVRGGTSEGWFTLPTEIAGESASHNNMPPYLSLNFIVYIGED